MLDLVVEFSTLGEYRLGADGALCPASILAPAPGREPQLGGACVQDAGRAAVRRIVAGGAAGMAPVATPAARRLSRHRLACGGGRRLARTRRAPGPEQLCLAV